jgi:hypothetical protein
MRTDLVKVRLKPRFLQFLDPYKQAKESSLSRSKIQAGKYYWLRIRPARE